ILVIAAINFFSSGPLEVGFPVLARFHWGGAQSLGFVYASFGLGAVAGAVLAGSLRRRPAIGVTIAGITVWLGAGLALFGILGVVTAVADGAVTGIAIGFVNVVGMTWIQRRTPPQRLGRLMSLITLAAMGLTPVALAVSGPAVSLSPVLLFAGAGALLVVTGLATLLSRQLREA